MNAPSFEEAINHAELLTSKVLALAEENGILKEALPAVLGAVTGIILGEVAKAKRLEITHGTTLVSLMVMTTARMSARDDGRSRDELFERLRNSAKQKDKASPIKSNS